MKCSTCGLEFQQCPTCGVKFAPKSNRHRFCTPLCGWRYASLMPEELLQDFRDLVEKEIHNRRGTILSASRISKKVLREMTIEYHPNDNRFVLMTNDIFERNNGSIFKITGKGKIYKFPPLKERKT